MIGVQICWRNPVILLSLVVLLIGNNADALGSVSKKDVQIIDSPLLTSKIQSNRSIIVDPEGDEDFTSVQKAVDSVPEGNSEWIIIHVRKGVYREKVVIPENKPFIFLRGTGKGKTHIVWNDVAQKQSSFKSATFTVHADNFVAFGISFKNDAPMGIAENNQSIAAFVGGDKVAFYHCAFYSAHNTLMDYKGRHYYESSYIQGSIDFISGQGQSIFQGCEIFVNADKRAKILGSIAAQNRKSPNNEGGFVFIKGKVYGVGHVYLGRAKGEHSRVIFAKTYLSKTVDKEGWTNVGFHGDEKNLLYGEYDCRGPGAAPGNRTAWSKQLTQEEVAPFMSIDFINGKEWLPVYIEDDED